MQNKSNRKIQRLTPTEKLRLSHRIFMPANEFQSLFASKARQIDRWIISSSREGGCKFAYAYVTDAVFKTPDEKGVSNTIFSFHVYYDAYLYRCHDVRQVAGVFDALRKEHEIENAKERQQLQKEKDKRIKKVKSKTTKIKSLKAA